MSKVAHYLQEHLLGEVSISPDARRFFSTDNSIFSVTPSLIVYPRNEHDVRKTARFSWQLAERGRVIPITARGAGTDFSGGAIGEGVLVVFPAHMNRIVLLDQKTGTIVVEPGLNYGRMQQTLLTHERFLPAYPASLEYSTVGGAVANNAAGEKSFKYGPTLNFVSRLRVVLSNGEVIETRRLSKRELNKKLGLSTFEGEIYRTLDKLIEENKDLMHTMDLRTTKNTAGYNLGSVKRKDGSFDLTPLFVGSQGTLGIVTEITLDTEIHNPETTLIAAAFESTATAVEAILELRKMKNLPCSIEMVNGALLDIVDKLNPNQLKGSIARPFPEAYIIVVFDDLSVRHRKKAIKQATQILQRLAVKIEHATNESDKARLEKIRQSSASLLAHSEQNYKAIPAIEDAIVPAERLGSLIEGLQSYYQQIDQPIAIWGHAGDGHIHTHPYFNLAELGEKQKVFKICEQYYSLVKQLGGSTSGEHNDGRLRGPYLPLLYGNEAYELLRRVKTIFDPYGILNPGVKVNVTLEDVKPMIRSHYSLDHLYNHMPRS